MLTPPLDAVILAAGNGLRLAPVSPLPKPLVTVGNRPLLDRILGALAHAGLERVHIVVGNRADSIRSHRFPSVNGLAVDWIENPDYNRANGVSLARAQGRVRSPFLLLMADHLFEQQTLLRFAQQPCPASGALLAVDRKLDSIYDLSDATKVATNGCHVRDIGKDVEPYQAVDTGMFLCSDAIFDAMKVSMAKGCDSLSGGVAVLAGRHPVVTWDIGRARWIDVDTPGARAEAERLAGEGCFDLIPPRCADEPNGGDRPRVEPSPLHRSGAVPSLVPLET